VEHYRTAAQGLRERDPDLYRQILESAGDDSEAEAAAQRDPDAYVALFLSHAGYSPDAQQRSEPDTQSNPTRAKNASVKRKNDIESWDFKRAITGAPDYDVETSVFLTSHFLEVLTHDALRVNYFGPLLTNEIMVASEDREYLLPVWEQRDVEEFLLGMRSAESRFTREGRGCRRVLAGMRRELQETGRIRVNLVPPELTAGFRSASGKEVATG
jgi:hypothetical protein